MKTTLDRSKTDLPGTIIDVAGDASVQKHLRELGLLPGLQVLKRKGDRASETVPVILLGRTLDQLKPGLFGTVRNIRGEGRIRRRLFDMGITPGAAFLLRKRAPLGDPLEIKIRNYELTLRKDEAMFVDVFVELELTKKEASLITIEPLEEKKEEER